MLDSIKVVWCLYDDGNMSWYNCGYDKTKYRMISIGIQEHNDLIDYYRIDLRLSNFDLIKRLEKLPKPDIIVASPPCESWSGADCKARIYNDDLSVKNENWYNDYNLSCHKNKRRDYFQKVRGKIIGEDTFLATVYIIKKFEPETYIIENPLTSYIWKYKIQNVDLGGYMNYAEYNSYDESYSRKPTIFFSNKMLRLENKRIKSNDRMLKCSYNKRSMIPKELLLDILSQI